MAANRTSDRLDDDRSCSAWSCRGDPASSSSSACLLRRIAGKRRGWCRTTALAKRPLLEGPLDEAAPAHTCASAQGQRCQRCEQHGGAGYLSVHRLHLLSEEGPRRRRPARPCPGRRAPGPGARLGGGSCRTLLEPRRSSPRHGQYGGAPQTSHAPVVLRVSYLLAVHRCTRQGSTHASARSPQSGSLADTGPLHHTRHFRAMS
jgi:hypothetical protein